MGDRGSLASEYAEYFSTIKSAVYLAFNIAYLTIKIGLDTGLFLASCGRRRPKATTDVEIESDDTQDSRQDWDIRQNFNVRYEEIKKTIPHSASRALLLEITSKQKRMHKNQKWDDFSIEKDIVFIPSLSLDEIELAKVPAIYKYEERQLCTLFYLKNPRVRLVFVSSMPVDPSTVEYYIRAVTETSLVPRESAMKRLLMVSCNDSSTMPLSAKILRRPRLIKKIKMFINKDRATMSCFISSNLERDLALQLDIPIFASDPALNYWGTKDGSREAFRLAGIQFPDGTDLYHSPRELSIAIAGLFRQKEFAVRRYVVKLNVGFSGEGNAILNTDCLDKDNLVESILISLENNLIYESTSVDWISFEESMRFHGAIAEEWVEDVITSPSA